jgi:hypothetical protein
MRNLIDTRRVLPAALAVSALLAITLVAVALLVAHRGHTGGKTTTPSPTSSSTPMPVPSGAVPLVQGARPADGIQVGYPHTIVGAISAASGYLGALASTLDPDYAASLGHTFGDPASPALPGNLATSVTALRTALQLPANGPVPPRSAFLTTPEMYQLREAGGDQVVVLLLTSNTFVNAQGSAAANRRRPVHPRHGTAN